MPYKDPKTKWENRKLKRDTWYPRRLEIDRMNAIKRFRLMGLEPFDLDDPMSDVYCLECSKETDRNEIYMNRHEVYCSYYAEKLPLPRYVKVGSYA